MSLSLPPPVSLSLEETAGHGEGGSRWEGEGSKGKQRR